MDGLKHPVGDQPTNIYWRRRLFVIIAIVVVALFLWWAISSLTSGSGTPAHSPTTTPTDTPSPGPSDSADPSRACTDTDITVVAAPKDGNFQGDSLPTFTLTVTSVASSPCIVDPTTGSKVVITSGSETWFESSTCNGYQVFDAEKFVIEPAATHDLTATWNRGRGDKGCLADPQPGTKAYYWFTGTVQGIGAEKIQFRIS